MSGSALCLSEEPGKGDIQGDDSILHDGWCRILILFNRRDVSENAHGVFP